MSDLIALLSAQRDDSVRGLHLVDDPARPRFLSFRALWEGACRRLGSLRARGLKPGDAIVIHVADLHELLVTFWATVLGGYVPVPVSVASHPEHARRLDRVLAQLGRPAVVTDAAAPPVGSLHVGDLPNQHLAEPARVSPDDVALIQFSSGSTGDPRGVVLTHHNLVTNATDIARRVRFSEADRTLLWMPLTHDMGLIGSHLAPLVSGFDQYLMSPATFVRHPERWLLAASEVQATILTTPNFGLEHFLRRGLPRLGAVDLSAIRLVVVGADPIAPQTCRAFARALAPAGLSARALFPVYGLSEASVAVTFSEPGAGITVARLARDHLAPGELVRDAFHDDDALERVALGRPLDHCEVEVVAPDGDSLPEGTVGAIHVRGDNVSRRYHGAVESHLADGWLHTGDLGFIRDGQLYVTGRERDIAFVLGQNVYLDDLDRIARHSAGRDAGTCVVTGPDAKEEVVVAVRFDGDPAAFTPIADRVAGALATEAGITPARVVAVGRLPKTTSGKLRRHQLAMRVAAIEGGHASLVEAILARARAHAPGSELTPDTPLLESGIPSLVLVELAADLEDRFGVPVRAVDLFSHPSVGALASHLAELLGVRPPAPSPRPRGRIQAHTGVSEPIAIIGMAASAPGAPDLASLWRLLDRGGDAVGPLPEARRADLLAYLQASGRDPGDLEDCPAGGYLPRIDTFDARRFGISQSEARLLHPAHRLLLETVDAALADARLERGAVAGRRTGIYLGHIGDLEGTQYRDLIRALAPDLLGLGATGNLGAFIAGRLANRLDTHGPAMMVDTACSASLAAVHSAAQAIRAGECDIAIAGAARVTVVPTRWPTELGFESVGGRCRPFDAGADGIAMGEGAGVVVLKPLSVAERDGDDVYATILGSALVHDGAAARLTAPNPIRQADAYRLAWARAEIDPRSLSFIEAHGAGTRLSDPIEVEAMELAFREHTADVAFCAIGSIKSNLGHLFEAAGVLGLIKATLSLWHRRLPPSLHYERPNPAIDFSGAPVFVSAEARPLGAGTLRAGVTSLGFSGTSCHVVLERGPGEATPRPPPPELERERLWIEGRAPAPDERSLRDTVAHLLRRYGDISTSTSTWDRTFAELGLDSLVLIQLRQGIESAFGVRLPMRELLGTIGTPAQLVSWLARAEPTDDGGSVSSPRAARQLAADSTQAITGGPPMPSADDALVAELDARFGASKRWVDDSRHVLANNRNVAGFDPAAKELTYPLVARRAAGSRFEDLDGNTLIDFAMGFGVALFGHDPPFIRDAIREVLDDGGLFLGPIHPLAATVAEQIVALTPCQRVAFYNSGTEAVMVAIRCARAVTGRDRIAIFSGSYHGSHDQVLAIAGLDGRSLPFAPGVAGALVSETLVLDYGRPEALDAIWAARETLAAVVVEPVQSRRPELQPVGFLRELRGLCSAAGIALVFDEVVTGFRLAPGGAQERFAVTADLVTYGKVLGGGLPIGVVAGQAAFMRPIDGGVWRFGDGSAPDPHRTFVAGTFCQHPLAMAAAGAVLDRLRIEGPELQRRLERRTERLVSRLNAVFRERDAPLHAVSCASLFRIVGRHPAERFFTELRARGIYLWEGRTCFVSTAHRDEDFDALVEAATHAARKLGTSRRAPRVPLTDTQRRSLAVARSSPEASAALNQAIVLRVEGALDRDRLSAAWRDMTFRHDALRAVAADEGGLELAPRGHEPQWRSEGEGIAGALGRAPDLATDPLWRLVVAQSNGGHEIGLVAHRLAGDGWSMGVVLEELAARYNDPEIELPAAVSIRRAATLAITEEGPDRMAAPSSRVFEATSVTTEVSTELTERLAGLLATGNTALTTRLAVALGLALIEESGRDEIALAVPVAGQALSGAPRFVGHLARLGRISIRRNADAMSEVGEQLVSLQDGAFTDLALSDPAKVDAVFNLDRAPRLAFDGLHVARVTPPARWTAYPLVVNAVWSDGLSIDWKVAPERIEIATVTRLAERLVAHLGSFTPVQR